MMNIQIHDGLVNMSNTGKNVLGNLQDNTTPVVDLLVRESIQNSTDAEKAYTPDDNVVDIKFDVKQLQNSDITCLFEGIAEDLMRQFPNGATSSCLTIRDTGTIGLTGHLSKKEAPNTNSWGNLIKLIYELNKAQDRSEAGGAWGLGKTVFYRLGIGMVLYYSRILDNGVYCSRLAACMVQDETSPKCIIPSHPNGGKSGIAWWGEQTDENETRPITDEYQICNILSAFGVSTFRNHETGTVIIVPFIDENKLLDTTRYESREGSEDNTRTPKDAALDDYPWMKNLGRFLKIAIQRWYYPRLDNPIYSEVNKKRYIKVYVNGEEVSYKRMKPIFQLQQALYNRALLNGTLPIGYSDFITYHNISDKMYGVEEITLRRDRGNTVIFREHAGSVAYVKVDENVLGMCPPDNNRPPYNYFDVDTDGKQVAVKAFSRRPGMIVWYETKTEISPEKMGLDDRTFILAHFALNSFCQMTIQKNGDQSIDNYLRSTEKANHMSWENDIYNVANKIKKQVITKVEKAFCPKPKIGQEEGNAGFGRIAGKLLPPKGFGSRPSIDRPNSGGNGDSKVSKKKLIVKQCAVQFEKGCLNLSYDIIIKADNLFKIELFAESESGKLDFTSLKKELQITEIPFEFESINVDVKGGGQFKVDQDMTYMDKYGLSVHMRAIEDSKANIVEFQKTNNEKDEIQLKMSIKLTHTSLRLKPSIEFSQL